MPIVTIQSPAGGSFQIDAPEGATDEQIFKFAQSQGLMNEPESQPQLRPEQAATPVNQDFIPTEENLAIPAPGLPERSFVGEVGGGLETAATLATGAIAEPLAGLSGIYAQATGGDPTKSIDETRAALTYEGGKESKEQLAAVGDLLKPVGEALHSTEKYLGDSVFNATGSAALASVAYSLPTVALEALGIKGFKGGKAKSTPRGEIEQKRSFIKKGYEPKGFNRDKIFTESAKKEQLDEVLASGDKERLAAMIDADPEFFKALDELGAKEKGLPSAASKNLQYQQTEQALKKIPGSGLAKTEMDQITELQSISDDMIKEFGGTTDKSELSGRLLNDSQKVIKDLDDVTEVAYRDIGAAVPKSAIIDMKATREAMTSELKSLRGDKSQMSALEIKLMSMAKENSTVTYHAVDKVRKQIGETLNKKSDVYKNESSGKLKKLYAVLSDDQGSTLKNKKFNMGTKYSRTKMMRVKTEVPVHSGLSGAWDAAKQLVVKRKGLEDASINMFGKNLNDAFMPKIGVATKKLTTGDYKKFFELIDSVPKKQRQEVIVSALNDVFTTGSRKEKQLSIAGYADWFNGLNSNPKLKNTFYQYLPKGLSKKLDSLGKVANGIRNAQAAAPVGGQLMASTGVASKVINGVGKKLLSKLPGFIGGIVEVGLEKAKGKGFEAAIDLLTDRSFVENINAIAKGQVKRADELEKKLMKTKKFKDFLRTLPEKSARTINIIGLTSWLAKSEKQEDQSNEP